MSVFTVLPSFFVLKGSPMTPHASPLGRVIGAILSNRRITKKSILAMAVGVCVSQIMLPLGLAQPVTFIQLTENEKAWLAGNKTIRMGVDPNYAPYSFVDKKGRYNGAAADFVQIIGDRLGITMEMVPGASMTEMSEAIKERTLDLITTIRKTCEREGFMSFTQPYIPTPLIIVTRKDYYWF